MNRNTGVIKAFGARFPRKQVLPIAFGYVRSNAVADTKEFVATIRNDELSAAAANGNDVADAYIFAQVVLQNSTDAVKAKATKLNLNREYRSIKINHTHTRVVVSGFFN